MCDRNIINLSLSSLFSSSDFFSVNLVKNKSAVEIGHSGQYRLSISTSAIILHWETLAIAHQWSRRSVIKLYRPQREGHLVLNIRRSASWSGVAKEERERGGMGVVKSTHCGLPLSATL